MTEEEIKKNYEKFDDEKLIKIAKNDINSLRNEFIPILEAELKKRNLSIENYAPIKNQTIFFEKEIFFSVEKNEYFKTTINLTDYIFEEIIIYINKGMRFKISTSLICIFFTSLVFSEIRTNFIYYTLLSLILFFLIPTFLKKIRTGKIVEIKNKKIIFSKVPFLHFRNIRFLNIFIYLQLLFNALYRIEIDYRDISEFYKKDEFFKKGYYIKTKKNIEIRVYLEELKKEELKKIIDSIKYKCIELQTKNLI